MKDGQIGDSCYGAPDAGGWIDRDIHNGKDGHPSTPPPRAKEGGGAGWKV